MDQRQWQEVFTIVRKYQRNMLGNTYDRSEYEKLDKILSELYPYAYGETNAKTN